MATVQGGSEGPWGSRPRCPEEGTIHSLPATPHSGHGEKPWRTTPPASSLRASNTTEGAFDLSRNDFENDKRRGEALWAEQYSSATAARLVKGRPTHASQRCGTRKQVPACGCATADGADVDRCNEQHLEGTCGKDACKETVAEGGGGDGGGGGRDVGGGGGGGGDGGRLVGETVGGRAASLTRLRTVARLPFLRC